MLAKCFFLGDSLHVTSDPILWEDKKYSISLSSAVFAHSAVEVN